MRQPQKDIASPDLPQNAKAPSQDQVARAAAGDMAAKILLSEHPRKQYRHTHGSRDKAMIDAARGGHIDAVRFLMDQENAQGQNDAALISASMHGHADIVALLTPLADHTACDHKALGLAAEGGYVEILAHLLPRYAAKHDKLQSALLTAVNEGHLEAVQLLATRADPKHNNSSALHIAAFRGHAEIIDFLLPISDVDKALEDASFTPETMAQRASYQEAAMLRRSASGQDRTDQEQRTESHTQSSRPIKS